jgi:hypothetical protein
VKDVYPCIPTVPKLATEIKIMNHDAAEEFFKVKEAFKAGKVCQWKYPSPHAKCWNDMDENFMWSVAFQQGHEIRIKPYATARPWTHDEAPIGAILKNKLTGSISLIIGVDKRVNNFVHAYGTWWFPNDLLEKNLVSIDGGKTFGICGVTE